MQFVVWKDITGCHDNFAYVSPQDELKGTAEQARVFEKTPEDATGGKVKSHNNPTKAKLKRHGGLCFSFMTCFLI